MVADPARSRSIAWQVILADLALILFLVSLSALPAAGASSVPRLADPAARGAEARGAPQAGEVAAAQALYRPLKGGPTLAQWLATQPRDPRATLTIFASHPAGGETAAWEAARSLAAGVRGSGVPVRIIITSGSKPDLYASLAYDWQPEKSRG
jgi:hypothetical protein